MRIGKLIIGILALAAGVTARAENGVGEPFVERLEESCTSGRFVLTTKVEDTPVTVSGTFVLQSDGYEITAEDFVILSDFKSRWTIDNGSKEVVVEDASSEDLAGLFESLGVVPVFDASGNPVRLRITAPDGIVSTVSLSYLSFTTPSNRLFAPDEKRLLSEGYVITDLR